MPTTAWPRAGSESLSGVGDAAEGVRVVAAVRAEGRVRSAVAALVWKGDWIPYEMVNNYNKMIVEIARDMIKINCKPILLITLTM